MTHDEKKLRKILALPSKLFPLSSASKGMAMDLSGGLTPLDAEYTISGAPVNSAYRKIAPPPPPHPINFGKNFYHAKTWYKTPSM